MPVRQCVPAVLTCLPPCRCTAGELTRWRPRGMQQGRRQPCRSGCRLGSAAGMWQPQQRRSCVWACCTTARCGRQCCPGSVAQDTPRPEALRATTTANIVTTVGLRAAAWPGSPPARLRTQILKIDAFGASKESLAPQRRQPVQKGVPSSLPVDSCRPCLQ